MKELFKVVAKKLFIWSIIQKYYFNKLQSMPMEQISNTHTGYIHKLITNLSFYFVEMTWQFEISVIPNYRWNINIYNDM